VVSIDKVRARAVRAPLPRPHKTASGTVEDALLVLVDVDCGVVVGSAYVFAYSPAVTGPLVQLIESIGELLVDRRVEPAALHDELRDRFRIVGTAGLVGEAIGGLDMALWDAFAKALDAPLWKVLGAATRPTPVYESMGMMSPDETRAEAAAAAEAGVTAFKVKAGHPEDSHDRANAEVLREVAGETGEIMLDFNQAFMPYEAIQRLHRLEDLRPAWIEEPVAAADLPGHALVRRATSVPVQTGENWGTPRDMETALMAGACDLVMIDAVRIGGVTGWMRSAAVAQAHSVPLSTHFYPEFSVHTMCASPTAQYIEWLDVSSAIVERPLEVKLGAVEPPDRPGAGIAWNEAAVARFALT
jgi:mandelate racemase